MKAYIIKGTGLGMFNGTIQVDLKTQNPSPTQFNASKIITAKNIKGYEGMPSNVVHATVFFIFPFPQRKIKKAPRGPVG